MKRVLNSVLVLLLAVPIVLCGAVGNGKNLQPMLASSKTGTPSEINYQGWLGANDTTAITGKYNMVFRLYTASTGGSAVWSESQDSVQVDKGIFNVSLGSVSPLPASIFTGAALYLETQVGIEVLSPRKKLVSVAYAIRSRYADTTNYAIVTSADTGTYWSLDSVNVKYIYKIGGNRVLSITGVSNLFTGVGAGRSDNGANNTFSGYNAGWTNTTGHHNTFSGANAGYSNLTGYRNTFSGDSAGYGNSLGAYNTFYGSGSGFSNTSGTYNTFSGYNAGYKNGSSAGNTFYGALAGYSNISGTGNTFSGDSAGYLNTGSNNTFYGTGAGYSNITGINNTFSGYNAGYHNLGNSNTFYGFSAGITNTAGAYNTFYGTLAGYSNTTSNYNTFLGEEAGYSNTSGINNIFSGYQAGFHNITGAYNTFYGSGAGYTNTGSSYNTFYGYWAGHLNTTGDSNTISGANAGSHNTTGYSNTFSGYNAGASNTTGFANTFVGSDAGYINGTGTYDVFLGYHAGANETGSNLLYIANSSGTPLIWGDFAAGHVNIGTKGYAYPLYVAGGAYCSGTNWVNASSRTYKENIKELNTEEAEKAFNDLKPVTFNYKTDKAQKACGFIAEDVPELVAQNGRKGVAAMDIVAVLTKVVQEQQKEINSLKQKVDQLEQK